jgi:hypothetical protein
MCAQTITLPRATVGTTLKFVVSNAVTGTVNISCRDDDLYRGALILIEQSLQPFLMRKATPSDDSNLQISAATLDGSFIDLVCITRGFWIATGSIYTTSTYSSFT